MTFTVERLVCSRACGRDRGDTRKRRCGETYPRRILRTLSPVSQFPQHRQRIRRKAGGKSLEHRWTCHWIRRWSCRSIAHRRRRLSEAIHISIRLVWLENWRLFGGDVVPKDATLPKVVVRIIQDGMSIRASVAKDIDGRTSKTGRQRRYEFCREVEMPFLSSGPWIDFLQAGNRRGDTLFKSQNSLYDARNASTCLQMTDGGFHSANMHRLLSTAMLLENQIDRSGL